MKTLVGPGIKNGSIREWLENREKTESFNISIYIERRLEERIETVVDHPKSPYENRSDFFREAAVELLEQEEVLGQ